MADYFQNWLNVGKKLTKPPKIFRVNWFLTGDDGKFVWPGFGENMRVLEWVIARCRGENGGRKTPLGCLPGPESLDLDGLSLTRAQLDLLFEVDREGWLETAQKQTEFFSKFGDRIPRELLNEQQALIQRLESWKSVPHPLTHP